MLAAAAGVAHLIHPTLTVCRYAVNRDQVWIDWLSILVDRFSSSLPASQPATGLSPTDDFSGDSFCHWIQSTAAG